MKTIISSVLLLLWLSTSLYIIDAREVAVILFFGDPISTVQEPGLKVKAPWPFHVVQRYDSRARILQIDPTEVFSKDTKNLVVSPFVIWKISDVQTFMERVKEIKAADRPLKDVVLGRVAGSIGEIDFQTILNTEAQSISLLPQKLLVEINAEVKRFGIEVQDIQLKQLGLPIQNEKSIYERMRAERSRIANKYRSEGDEQALIIRAKADLESAKIRLQAEQEAARIVAQAEKEAAKRYAEAYSQDPQLYQLLRDIETSEATLGKDSQIILDSTIRPYSTLMGTAK